MNGDLPQDAIRSWAGRNPWIPVSTDDLVRLGLARIQAAQTTLTRAEAHELCIGMLSPVLYSLCVSSDDQNKILGFESLGQYLIKMGSSPSLNPGDNEILAESVQASLVLIHASLGNIKSPQAFIGYCQVVFSRELSRRIKKRNKGRGITLSIDEPLDPNEQDGQTRGESMPDDEPVPDEIVAEIDQQNGFWKCLDATRLSQRSKVILFLRYKLELTFYEIGEMFAMARQAIDTSLSRARDRLRKDQGFIDCLKSIEYSI